MLHGSLVALLAAVIGCAAVTHVPPGNDRRLGVRFLLTFDDGPDTSAPFSSTIRILEALHRNAVQADVKAVFFVQTRNDDGGGSASGRAILERQHAEGHVLGLHSGTRRGHVSHTSMSAGELDESLRDGVGDLLRITGRRPLLVRPPYWWVNEDTLEKYGSLRLHVMPLDINAYDGVNWGMHVFRRRTLRVQLMHVRYRLVRHELPAVAGRAPVIVGFHDTNAVTARHLPDYLRILVEEARALGLPLDARPFYDDAAEITAAALRRAVTSVEWRARP